VGDAVESIGRAEVGVDAKVIVLVVNSFEEVGYLLVAVLETDGKVQRKVFEVKSGEN